MSAVPPLIPGSQVLSTLQVETAKINELMLTTLRSLPTWRGSVRVASTDNVNVTAGSSPSSVDGVTLEVGNKVLLKDQTDATQNGVYTVTTVGTGVNGTWVRSDDMKRGTSAAGVAFFVNEGSTNEDRVYVVTNDPGTGLTGDIVGEAELVFQTVAAAPMAQGLVNQVQVSDGDGNLVASTVTATTGGVLTVPTSMSVTTGNITATAGDVVVTDTMRGLTLSATKATTTAANWAAGATLNARQGLITVTNTDVAADTPITFIVTNNLVAADSLIFLNMVTNGNSAPVALEVSAINAGVSFTVRLVAPVVLNGTASGVLAFAIM